MTSLPSRFSRSRRRITALVHAFERQDAAALRRLLHPDAAATIDSGGTLPIAEHARGREAVAKLIDDLLALFPGVEPMMRDVNARPGVVLVSAGVVVGVIAVAERSGRVHQLWAVVNPDKLRGWRAI